MSTKTLQPNYSLGCAGLKEDDTTANQFEIANAFAYVINGRTYQKAASGTGGETFTSGHTALAAKQQCAFFVMINSSGTISTIQSSIQPTIANTTTIFVPGAWEIPKVADKACIGAIIVQCNNAATFTPNSVDLGATDVVDTYVNFGPDINVPVPFNVT